MAWINTQSFSRHGASSVTLIEDVSGLATKEFLLADDVLTTIRPVDLDGDFVFELLGIRIEYTADSNGGTRELWMEIKNFEGTINFSMRLNSATDIMKSTSKITEMMLGVGMEFVPGPPGGGPVVQFLPRLYLGAGDILKVFAIGGTVGDNMVLHIRGRLS